MRAIDFAIENDVYGIKMKLLLENIEAAKSSGDDIKASMLVKRL
jgi:hypothetical protein